MAEHFTSKNFEQEVLHSELPVLVDFWADWCGPCKMLAPALEELSAEADGFRVGKVNVDEEPALTRRYRIVSVPMLMVFKGGEVVEKAVGALTLQELHDLVAGAK